MQSVRDNLLEKIQDRSALIAVIGLGYVGLPLAVEKAKAGYRTIGLDIQASRVQMVNEGCNYIGDVVDAELKALVEQGMLSATTDFRVVKNADFIAICVPTPLDAYQQPDISYVRDSTIEISKHLKKCFLQVEFPQFCRVLFPRGVGNFRVIASGPRVLCC